jgi:hypothetical protein
MLRFLSRTLFGLGLIAAAACLLPAQSASANDEPAPAQPTQATRATAAGKHYFVEFRGRSAASYGHLYVMYGEVNGRGEVLKSRIAGLYPAGDKQDCENCSLANWTIGHMIFVPSGTTATDGDLEEKYVTARYRVMLTKAQYQKLNAYITKFQADPPLWHALWRNCVSFGRDIANVLDLKVPAFIWLTPEQFVEQLREMNGTPSRQAPLKDVGNTIETPASTAVAHQPAARPHKQTASAGTAAGNH